MSEGPYKSTSDKIVDDLAQTQPEWASAIDRLNSEAALQDKDDRVRGEVFEEADPKISGDKKTQNPPMCGSPDIYLDSRRAFRVSVQELADERERLISERSYLISLGVNPDDLEPIDGYEALMIAKKAHPLLQTEFGPLPTSTLPDDITFDGIKPSFMPEVETVRQYEWDGDPKGKDSNPKDAIGSRKVGLSVLPRQVLYEVALGMLEGALKYARHNYRVAGVRASVYKDACDRHMDAWWEGQDTDPGSGLHHVVKAIASLVVLRDSMLAGNWFDDRPPSIGDPNWLAYYNKEAERIIDAFKGEPKRPFIKGDNE